MCEQLAAINARDRRRTLSSAGVDYRQGFASLSAPPLADNVAAMVSVGLAEHII